MSTVPVAAQQFDDLRTTFLFTFDTFATDPVEIADAEAVPGVDNARHARELLGVLVQAGLVAQDLVDKGTGKEDVWQVINPGTYDDHTREEAEAVFDATFTRGEEDTTPAKPETKPAPAKADKPKKDTNPADLPFCKCGCGANVGRKSNYKPGHDARHAGDVARSIAAGGDREALLDTLPSDALRTKAGDMADRLIGKKQATSDKVDEKIATEAEAAQAEANPAPAVEEPTPIAGKVKVGRSQYDAAKIGDQVFYEDKTGEEITASDKVAASFVANS